MTNPVGRPKSDDKKKSFHVSIFSEQDEFVTSLIKQGEYASRSEFARDAIGVFQRLKKAREITKRLSTPLSSILDMALDLFLEKRLKQLERLEELKNRGK